MISRISLPFQLLIVIIGVQLFGGFVDISIIRFFYTFSVIFKDFLSFILPAIVFLFVLNGILSFKKSAPLVLAAMVALIFTSNGIVALLAYAIMNVLFKIISCGASAESIAFDNLINPYVTVSVPTLVSSEKALIGAVILGLFFSFIRWSQFENAIESGKNWIEKLLNWLVIPLLPIYVLGFLLKINYEGAFVKLAQHYGSTFALIVVGQIIYLIWLYYLASGFSAKKAWTAMVNALPSYLTAFSTMSSTVTVPVSVKAAVQNTGNRPLANMAMPIMANVHLLGDSISTPILAMMTMVLFKGCLPSIGNYLNFVFYFCTSMFAVSGIPGGGILVMIPILISQFGFNAEMVSVITTLYLLMDPFGTAANVMGDGALVIIINNVLKRLRIID